MSVSGIQQLRARILADDKIDNNEVEKLIQEAEDGFWFFKHVSADEHRELKELLETHQDKFEAGAKDRLANFLYVRAPTVTSASLANAFSLLKDAMDAARDASGAVNLDAVAQQVQGDEAAEAALEVIKREYATTRPVTITDSCGGQTTEMREVAPKKLNLPRATTVFNALLDAKREAAGLDKDSDGVVNKAERDAAGQLDGLSGRIVKGAVEEAGRIKPIGTSC